MLHWPTGGRDLMLIRSPCSGRRLAAVNTAMEIKRLKFSKDPKKSFCLKTHTFPGGGTICANARCEDNNVGR